MKPTVIRPLSETERVALEKTDVTIADLVGGVVWLLVVGAAGGVAFGWGLWVLTGSATWTKVAIFGVATVFAAIMWWFTREILHQLSLKRKDLSDGVVHVFDLTVRNAILVEMTPGNSIAFICEVGDNELLLLQGELIDSAAQRRIEDLEGGEDGERQFLLKTKTEGELVFPSSEVHVVMAPHCGAILSVQCTGENLDLVRQEVLDAMDVQTSRGFVPFEGSIASAHEDIRRRGREVES